VLELREGQQLSYAAISDLLNALGIPTPAGRRPWQKSYVDRLLHTRHARQLRIQDLLARCLRRGPPDRVGLALSAIIAAALY